MSALPVVGIEVPAVYFGKVALDSVGLRVGPSCPRLDPEDTPPALLDERGMMTDVHLGVTPDGGPMAGAPILEPSPDGGCKEGEPVLEPLEHSVPEKALDDRPMVGFENRDLLEYFFSV